MTRFEKFKSLDIEELAYYLMGTICEMIDDWPNSNISCRECAKCWLEEEI